MMLITLVQRRSVDTSPSNPKIFKKNLEKIPGLQIKKLGFPLNSIATAINNQSQLPILSHYVFMIWLPHWNVSSPRADFCLLVVTVQIIPNP